MKKILTDIIEPRALDLPAPVVGHYLPGRSRRLVVSLAGVGKRRFGVPPIEFFGSAGGHGENHVLFISDRSRSWMNGEGVAYVIQTTIEEHVKAHNIETVVTLGNSMGGFAALILPDILRVDTVIAFAPQFSAMDDHVPEETRWAHHRNNIDEWVYPTVGPLEAEGTTYFVFHGNAPEEAIHWQRFPTSKKLNHFIFADESHNVAVTLQKRRRLSEVIKHAMDQRSRVVRRTLERSFLRQKATKVLRRSEFEAAFPEPRQAFAGGTS